MFHMANDSRLFRTTAELPNDEFVVSPDTLIEGTVNTKERYVPLIEARMIHIFDHRWATYEGKKSRETTASEKSDSSFEVIPWYWVKHQDVASRIATKGWRYEWLMGWRDITNIVNERSLIAAAIPWRATNHKVPLFFTPELPPKAAALLANLNSLIVDYILRQKLSGASLTYFYLKQLPVLPASAYMAGDLEFVAHRVLELSYTSWSLQPFARDLGYDGPPFEWDENRRALLRAELDAWYARAYGITRDELRYILDPADVMGADYPSETFRVLKKNEIAKFGEYRTARLVLDAWDRMQRGELAKP